MLGPEITEVDNEKFLATAKFCVYLHSRPDGSVFYVGKGLRHRAYEFAPSRRTQHHLNIVKKYGKENIGVRIIPCMCEREANMLERAHIKAQRLIGANLVNLTDGGEGVSGRTPTAKQSEALSKGRGKVAFSRLSEEAKSSVFQGLARGRERVKLWRNSPQGVAHLRRLGNIGRQALGRPHDVVCAQCGIGFVARSWKAKCCGRRCEQRLRRSRGKLIS